MSPMVLNEALPPGDVAFDPEASTIRICEQFGFSYHAVCYIGVAEQADSRSVILSNFVPEAIALLDRAGWWNKFEAVVEAVRSGRPIHRGLKPPESKSSAESRKQFGDLMRIYDVDECLTVPLHCGSQLGVAYLVGNKLSLTSADIEAIQIAMLGIFQRICEMNPLRDRKVSPREIECLSLTSRGKTSQEVGTMLSISEHTVVRHLAAATQKLDASNRGQAVARALRLGLIE